MAECLHLEFNASVTVHRIVEDEVGKEEQAPIAFYAEIQIACRACDTPMEFLGVPLGLNQNRPTASIDFTELNAPIKPQGSQLLAKLPGFSVRVHHEDGDGVALL